MFVRIPIAGVHSPPPRLLSISSDRKTDHSWSRSPAASFPRRAVLSAASSANGRLEAACCQSASGEPNGSFCQEKTFAVANRATGSGRVLPVAERRVVGQSRRSGGRLRATGFGVEAAIRAATNCNRGMSKPGRSRNVGLLAGWRR